MKKVILIAGLSLCFIPFPAKAFPDGVPSGGFGGFNPGAVAPGAFGAYEMQLLRDQKQREMMKEDFEIYQKKKAIDAKKEKETVLNDNTGKSDSDDIELNGTGDTFVKKIRNKSRSNPNLIQKNGKAVIKSDEVPVNAVEIKTPKKEAGNAADVEEAKPKDDIKPQIKEAEDVSSVPAQVIEVQTQEPLDVHEIRAEEAPAEPDVKPVSVKPAAKAKPWLDIDMTNVPIVQPDIDNDIDF